MVVSSRQKKLDSAPVSMVEYLFKAARAGLYSPPERLHNGACFEEQQRAFCRIFPLELAFEQERVCEPELADLVKTGTFADTIEQKLR